MRDQRGRSMSVPRVFYSPSTSFQFLHFRNLFHQEETTTVVGCSSLARVGKEKSSAKLTSDE